MTEDYYQILGVSRDSGTQEIRRAYYRMAKSWHPDLNHARDAKSRFQEISRAYSVLSDPSARAVYDGTAPDPWVRNRRRDYYRYGTSSGRPASPGNEPPAQRQEPYRRDPMLDQVLFATLLFVGISAIGHGIFDVLTSEKDEAAKIGGLVLGLFFTAMLAYGWTVLKKERSSKDTKDTRKDQ